MIGLAFEVEYEKEYKVLNSYYIYDDNKEGILFIVKDEESGATSTEFLPRNQLSDQYEWFKSRKDNVQYRSAGIEGGEKNILIVETGYLKGKKKNVFSEKEASIFAKKYRFIIKENN